MICGARSKMKMHNHLFKIIKNFKCKIVTSEYLIKPEALLSTGSCVTQGTCLTHTEGLWSGITCRGLPVSKSGPCVMVHVSDDALSCQTQEGEDECHYSCIQGYFNRC